MDQRSSSTEKPGKTGTLHQTQTQTKANGLRNLNKTFSMMQKVGPHPPQTGQWEQIAQRAAIVIPRQESLWSIYLCNQDPAKQCPNDSWRSGWYGWGLQGKAMEIPYGGARAKKFLHCMLPNWIFLTRNYLINWTFLTRNRHSLQRYTPKWCQDLGTTLWWLASFSAM